MWSRRFLTRAARWFDGLADDPSLWLEDQLVRPFLDEEATAADPTARRSGLIDGRRGARARYEMAGRTVVTHYVMSDDGSRPGAPTTAHGATAVEGVAVVTWTANAFQHALVADVPADTLIALAPRAR